MGMDGIDCIRQPLRGATRGSEGIKAAFPTRLFPSRRLICQSCGSIPLTKILDSTTFQLQELAPEETLKYFVLQACVHAILP